MNHDIDIADARRRIALGASLNMLLNHNPDFRTVFVEGFLNKEVLKHSLNINLDKPGTISFLKGVAVFNKYLTQVARDAEQAQIDLHELLQMTQDAR